MRHRFTCLHRLLLVALAVVGLRLPIYAADWPTYMHDNTRSGITTDTLSLGTLDEQWVHTAPAAPVPAWPGIQTGMVELPTKMRFDDAFYTVGVGDLVYFGSSVDNKIYALDADDGSIVWSYFTGGAVRTAPTISGGYLYAASDDGYIYCLNATTGAFVWKYSTMATQKSILGNGRMVSKQPSRTGVMVDNGTVYFGSGNFRTDGIAMTALNASTSSVVWNNSTAASQQVTFTPQGYPLLTSSYIIAPSGRFRPSAFNRSTGAYAYTAVWPTSDVKGSASGAYVTMAADASDTFYVGTQNLLRAYYTATGERRVAFDWTSTKRLIATATRYYVLQGQAPPGTGDVKVYAYNRAVVDAAGDRSTATLNSARLWTFTQSGLDSMILTGNYLVVGGDDMVYALDVTDGSKDWEHAVDGRAAGLTVADNQLYVSTDTGKIHCFGNGTPVTPPTPTYTEPFNDAQKSDYEDAAVAILAETAISKGYCLVTGTGDAAARLGYEIAERAANLHVYCVMSDEEDAQVAREALKASGANMYGTRIAVDVVSGTTLPYPDYFANLVIHVSEYGQTDPSGSELLRVTKPCGGRMLYGPVTGYTAPAPSGADQTLWDAAGTFAVEADDEFLQGAGEWYLLNRDPLTGAGSWTHQYANAANTGSSEDQWVRGTLGVLWYGAPGADETPDRHLKTVAPLSHNGRVFHQGYNYATGRTYILCYDAYNGTRYWETDITGAYRVQASQNSSNLACTDEYLFVVAGTQCKRLDVATGQISATYNLPDGSTEAWGYLAVANGLLIGSEALTDDIDSTDYQRSDTLFARDIATGDLEWTYSDGIFRNNLVAVSEGCVYLVEQRAGQTGNTRSAVALDLTDGDLLWERTIDITNTGSMVLVKNGVLALGVVCTPYGGNSDPNRRILALSTADGSTLWDKAVANKSRPLVIGNTLIVQPYAYHLISGQQVMNGTDTWHLTRGSACGAMSASASLFFYRDAYPTWCNAFTLGKAAFYNLRPGCWINIVPAGGVVVQPEAGSGCRCYYALQCAITYQPTATEPNVQPTVSLTSPNEDEVFNGAITMTASASDSDGTINRVEFYADGKYLGEDTSSPYSYTWADPWNGELVLTAIAYDTQGGITTSAAVNVRENTPPTVNITEPVEDEEFNGPFSITATASDTDGSVTKVEFYEDGQYLGEDIASPYSYTWEAPPVGAHALTAKAYDNEGKNNTSVAVNVEENNTPPTVSITSPTDYQRFVSTPASITISVNAADTDGTVSKVEFYNGTTKLGEDTTSPYSYNWTGVGAGAYVLSAKAIDNVTVYTISASVHVNAGPNSAPTVSITAPVNGGAVIGNTVTITADAADTDGMITKVEFFDGSVKLGEDTSSPYSYEWINGPLGIQSLTAKATDNESTATTSSAAVITVWNTQDIGSPAVAGSGTYSDGTFTVTGAGVGLTGTADQFRFVYLPVNGDCTIIARIVTCNTNSTYPSARGGVMIRETLDAGSKEMAITLKNRTTIRFVTHSRLTTGGTDSYGYVDTTAPPKWLKMVRSGNSLTSHYSTDGTNWSQHQVKSITMGTTVYVGLAMSSWNAGAVRTATFDNVSVTGANLFPDVSVTSPTSGARYSSAPADITLTADAADPDGTVSKVEFYEAANKLGEDTTSPFSFDWTNVADNDYVVTAKAIDAAGIATTSSPVTVRVGPNHLPTVNITSPAGGAVFNGDIAITATASDTDGTISTVELYQGTTKIGEDTSSPYACTWVAPPVGTHALTAKAIDNESGETTSSSVSVRENAPPTVSITSPENDHQFTTVPATITIDVDASDTDGSITKVEFYQGTTKLGEDSISPYSYQWAGVAEGAYTLTAKAIDNDTRTTTSTAIMVTVAVVVNEPPMVSITSPDEGDVFSGGPISITADASDVDGTVTLVEFYAGSTKLGEDSTEPYSYDWASPSVGSHALTAIAYDDDTDSTISTTVNVRVNALPTVSITNPTDEEVFDAPADITITANAADTDGTVTKVEFYQGTTKLGEDSTSPYSYTWNSVSAGSYTLTAKAIDNDSGVTTSVAVDIVVGSNALPTVSITAPTEGQVFNGAINITATASDSDGAISKVEFYEDGNLLGEDSTSPYSYNWASPPSGTQALTAKAYDNEDGSATSTAVNVRENAPPTVGITAPTNGASFAAPANITITADAADSDGSISLVEFYNGTTKLGEDSTSPYSYAWNSVAAGSYTLTTKATDNDSGITTSTGVAVNVVYEVIVDNPAATKVGSWPTSTSTGGYYGSNYAHDNNIDKGTKTATYTPNLPVSGNYTVYCRYAALSNRASNTPIDINYNGGSNTVTVNQRTGGGTWVSLGTYSFVAGTSGTVVIRTTGTDGYVIADAIRFVSN